VDVALTARIEDALLLQRRVTPVTNNYVIKNAELDELGGFDEVLSGADGLRCFFLVLFLRPVGGYHDRFRVKDGVSAIVADDVRIA
jgi:hypothetical protein